MSNSTTTTTRVTKQLTVAEIAQMSGDVSKGVSLCIPRVFANISWYRIKQVFISLNWGFVERVDVIPSGGTKRAFVHFAPGKFTATKVLDALCEGKPVKIVYDEPWFWQISLSRSAKPVEAPERKQKPKVEIDPVLGSGDQKRHRSGRKLTLDLSETNTVPGNCPIKSRQQEHEKAVAKTIEEGEIAE
ncbi:MAG: hypothetical protein CXT73_03075 [Methanobacteriota archaeon]|jgi:hypothetical protein|nr:MAG: hypothetical protein CXT73_03075 [Euryarchaeota archaeon]